MFESFQKEQPETELVNIDERSIEEMRYGMNEISLPFLERNELGSYFRQYPELKDMGFEGCKKKLSQGIQHILTETQKHSKAFIHPSESRSRYVQLHKWLVTHLQSLQSPETHQQLSTLQFIEQQKKLILTTHLELLELFSIECKQKSELLKLIITLSMQIINTLLIELENTSANMLVGYLKEKNSSQKELIERIGSLEKTIDILEKEKNNKWKNLYIVVKDNRVLKKQNTKLIKMLNSEQEKVRILNEEHLKIKDQNEKFKLFLSSDKEQQTKKLSRYVQAKVQMNQIDRLIKLYPKQAQRIAYAELKNIQMSQLNTLEEKIAHIIKAIEKSGQLIHQKDQGDDFLDTNKAKMCFNISIQTQVDTQEIGINTYNKVLLSKHIQVCDALKHNNLYITPKVLSLQIKPHRQPARSIEKKKTKPSMATIKGTQKDTKQPQQTVREASSSIKDMISNKKVKWNDEFLILRTVNFRYLPDTSDYPVLKKQTSLFRRRQSFSSSDSSDSDRSDTVVRKEKSVRFDNGQGDKRSLEATDSNIKPNESRLKRLKSKEKRMARFQNLHTFSSKSKMKDFRLVESELWKINKTYNLSIKEPSKFCQNVFVSTLQDRNKNRKTSLMSGYSSSNTQKFFLTTFPGALKTYHEERYQEQNEAEQRADHQDDNPNKNKSIFDGKIPEAVNKKIYRVSKEKITNVSLQLKKNPSKISTSSNEPKILPKKSTPKNIIPKVSSKKRERQQSQESLLSVQTGNQAFNNRFSFQKDTHEDMLKNESLLRQLDNEEIVKRSSQFSRGVINSHVLKAKKYNRQSSVLLNRLKNPNMRLMTQMGPKRDSEISYAGLVQNAKHLRTRTQGIDQIDEIAEEQTISTFKHLRGSVERIKDLPMIHKVSEVQDQFEQTLRPKSKFGLLTLGDMERLQQIDSCRFDTQEDLGAIDLIKSIERVIKNISQRSVQIIKKEYLFKQFLLSSYQLQYGNSKENIPKSYVQFLKQLKKPRYSTNPMVQCLYLLMNESYSEVYRREIFKLFTILIDKNGGSLTDYAGEHQFYRKIMTELLGIFIEPSEVQQVIRPMCLEQLKGSLSDYFIAIEGEIRKRSINSQLYSFMADNIIQFGETTVSFEIIKEITFFIAQGNKRVKNQLIELRMYSEPYIQLHRLCLIVGRLKFNEFMHIGSWVQKKYNQLRKATGLEISPYSMMNLLAKQRFDNFPYLKQVLHRQIQCFYKYNSPISQLLLKLCQVNLFSQKIQNESPIADCLRFINEQTEKLQRLKYYKQVLQNTSK